MLALSPSLRRVIALTSAAVAFVAVGLMTSDTDPARADPVTPSSPGWWQMAPPWPLNITDGVPTAGTQTPDTIVTWTGLKLELRRNGELLAESQTGAGVSLMRVAELRAGDVIELRNPQTGELLDSRPYAESLRLQTPMCAGVSVVSGTAGSEQNVFGVFVGDERPRDYGAPDARPSVTLRKLTSTEFRLDFVPAPQFGHTVTVAATEATPKGVTTTTVVRPFALCESAGPGGPPRTGDDRGGDAKSPQIASKPNGSVSLPSSKQLKRLRIGQLNKKGLKVSVKSDVRATARVELRLTTKKTRRVKSKNGKTRTRTVTKRTMVGWTTRVVEAGRTSSITVKLRKEYIAAMRKARKVKGSKLTVQTTLTAGSARAVLPAKKLPLPR